MYDIRALANWVLDRAQLFGRPISNLSLNKILYFMYFHFLAENGQVLTAARIEAWEHGPVFREIYHEFKMNANAHIVARAETFDITTRTMKIACEPFADSDVEYMEDILNRYIQFDALQLRELSHEQGGAWDRVWNGEHKPNPGMVISNEIILLAARERILH